MQKQYIETKFGELKEGDLFWSNDTGNLEFMRQKVKIGPDKARHEDGTKIELLYPQDFVVFKEIEVYGWYEYIIWMCISGIILTTLAVVFWIVQKFMEK
jgi:hypothetical protein